MKKLESAMDGVTRVAYTVVEAAEALGISRTRAFAAVKAGTLKSYKDGRRRMVPVAAVSEYVRHKEGNASDATYKRKPQRLRRRGFQWKSPLSGNFMKNHMAGAVNAQEHLVRAYDPDIDRYVMLAESEAAEVKAITGVKTTANGWLMTPALVRQLGFGRSPFRDYPEPEDPRVVHLVEMVPPGTLVGQVATVHWQATILRADGVRQSIVITDLADARDELFSLLPEDERLDIAAPFLGRRAVA
ncbi:helix-turn-helix domain-containing protein [Luteibacter sp. NPDC031894]|uniref:helix-turn-helix domain-containing protein n=1 Tax=Luteibacter sp. NPDC031894 TaxID=3390572 RepID=UPI003D00F51D